MCKSKFHLNAWVFDYVIATGPFPKKVFGMGVYKGGIFHYNIISSPEYEWSHVGSKKF